MQLPVKDKPKISSWPTGWPSDGRSKIIDRDDVTIIMHPNRHPQKFDPTTKQWSAL